MEWLNSILQPKNPRALTNSEEECDPQACYDSFKEHWHQALKIFNRVQQMPSHDDVLSVVNHLEQMATLLLYDIRRHDRLCMSVSSSRCLEYLLTEGILDKLFEWSIRSGRYTNAVRCEQLKLYKMLISQSRHILLVHEPFLRPMIKLLCSCEGEVFSQEIEKLLVDLLNQLSALLMQNIEFIDLFFREVKNVERFIIFLLLIPFVHREDSIGMQARDALLLCMSLSKKNKKIASGLSALYSVLPNMLNDITVPDWHRFTPDDVNEIKGLLTFVTSLEFSNAVAQVAHPVIRKQLQEFLYRGFLIPVLGPALLQTNVKERVAATAYLELILRTVTQPGLLHSMLQFLLKVDYDGERLLDILIQRINSERQLCLVSLAVFESMVDLDCEDLMLELVFKHLQPCLHLMLSQRKILLPLDPHCQSFERLLTLSPKCCQLEEDYNSDGNNFQWNHFKHKQSLYGKYYAYLCDARSKIGRCQMACMTWNNSYTGEDDITQSSEENSSSLISLERSSGYESFNLNCEESKDESEFWLSSNSNRHKKSNISPTIIDETDHLSSSASAGPFLTILMEKLAVYPQPLLRAYLLDHSLVLQPNVPSIFEIIGLLQQKIDEYMSRQSESASLIKYARDCLVDREIMLVNLRRYHAEMSLKKPEQPPEPFQRNGPKRRSLNIPPISTLFGRRPSQIDNNVQMTSTPEELQFNLIYPKFNEGQHVALCAVLLEEWVKELAALAQEHTVAQLATLLK
ncbi:hypothetical protein NQ315_010248 [Exocentrus adspersus]|uniref:FHF complex subunit HOOK-interacting protein C-terminal domain-containing protein n=1 Tax=Exocentrus adspersus TaxID=1586481 RepID=A0AAV8WAT4_9CUCU|nr:hypothetical protein NQ315_010248 [Exocentrus adspersus]